MIKITNKIIDVYDEDIIFFMAEQSDYFYVSIKSKIMKEYDLSYVLNSIDFIITDNLEETIELFINSLISENITEESKIYIDKIISHMIKLFTEHWNDLEVINLHGK